MSIYIVQHGKCLSKEIDPERGLSEEGIKDTTRIAEVAKNYQVPVSVIIHSGKKRAAQTATIFSEFLRPESGIQEASGINPLDDVPSFSKTIANESNMMIVGHLPFLEKLIAWLITGDTDIPVFKLQNGGIVCLDQIAENNQWSVKWALMPHVG